ncbi:MAG: hypothetical protein QM776_08805 [Rhodocyclaceae bacterium]
MDESMRRVKQNVELLASRLNSAGYEFVDTGSDSYAHNTPHVPPSKNAPALVGFLEALIGPLPLTLVGWIEHVGDVNFLGNHPAWPERDMQTDALVVEFELSAYADRYPGESARNYFEDAFRTWSEDVAEYGVETVGRFALPFAPDALHKINVSGGESYGIYIPDNSVDATCRIDGRDVSFINYLRRCFACGGFPGEPSLPGIPELAKGLLPI